MNGAFVNLQEQSPVTKSRVAQDLTEFADIVYNLLIFVLTPSFLGSNGKKNTVRPISKMPAISKQLTVRNGQ